MNESVTTLHLEGADFTVHYQAGEEVCITKILLQGVNIEGFIRDDLYESIESKLMEPADVD